MPVRYRSIYRESLNRSKNEERDRDIEYLKKELSDGELLKMLSCAASSLSMSAEQASMCFDGKKDSASGAGFWEVMEGVLESYSHVMLFCDMIGIKKHDVLYSEEAKRLAGDVRDAAKKRRSEDGARGTGAGGVQHQGEVH